MQHGDLSLARRVGAGDTKAFEEFLDRYGDRVHRLVRRYLAEPMDVEDATQSIFLDLYKCLGNYRGESSLSTWVYRVAMNHCLRHRGKRQEAESFDEERDLRSDRRDDPAHTAGQTELSGQVHRAVQKLSPVQRDVVVLHELHELTYAECAAVLQIPVGTVKSRLSNAFRALRSGLHDYVRADGNELQPEPVGELS